VWPLILKNNSAMQLEEAKSRHALRPLQLDNKSHWPRLAQGSHGENPNSAVSRQSQERIDPSGNHGDESECQTYTSRVNTYILIQVWGGQPSP
jgi:hypothetical protein